MLAHETACLHCRISCVCFKRSYTRDSGGTASVRSIGSLASFGWLAIHLLFLWCHGDHLVGALVLPGLRLTRRPPVDLACREADHHECLATASQARAPGSFFLSAGSNGSQCDLIRLFLHQLKVPYKAILKSAPVYAILIAHVGQNWGYYTLLTQMPKYMKDVLNYNLQEVFFNL